MRYLATEKGRWICRVLPAIQQQRVELIRLDCGGWRRSGFKITALACFGYAARRAQGRRARHGAARGFESGF